MNSELFNLQRKVNLYKEVLQNTRDYRDVWGQELKEQIKSTLLEVSQSVGLDGKIDERTDMENLEAIVFSLGNVKSGMYQKVDEDIKRHLIKHNGSLIYQQLFNGKIIVLIQYPYIENYGQPRPPKTIAIYRPEELKPPYFQRHLEEFITDITNWEDYDDDEPNKRIGFQLNFGPDGTAATEPERS